MRDKEVVPSCGEEGSQMEALSLPHDASETLPCAAEPSRVITESMLETEKDMEKITLEKEAEMKHQAKKEVSKLDSSQREVRYQQLKFLLIRSQAYAAYLESRIQCQKAEAKLRRQVVMEQSVTSQSDTTTNEAQDGSPESVSRDTPTDSNTEEIPTKERTTTSNEPRADILSNDSTQDAIEQCTDSSVLGQKSDEAEESKITIPETVSTDLTRSCTSDQITTSDEPSRDEGTTSCENAETGVSPRRTRARSMATVSSDTRPVEVNTSGRRTRSHVGTVNSDACSIAEVKSPSQRTRRRATISTEAAEVITPVSEAKTKVTIPCETHKVVDANTLTLSPQRTRNGRVVSCDVRKDVLKRTSRRQTRSMETIPCDSASGTEASVDVPVKQTDGDISCDAPRVTRSRLKTGVYESVEKKATRTSRGRTSEQNDKKTVIQPRPTRKRKADAITDCLAEAFDRIQSEAVEKKTKADCSEASVDMDTAAKDAPTSVADASSNDVHVTSACDVSMTEGAPPPDMSITEGATPPAMSITEGATPPVMSITEGAMPPDMSTTEGAPPPDMSITDGAPPPDMSTTEEATPPDMPTTEGAPPPDMSITEEATPPDMSTTEEATPPVMSITEGATPPDMSMAEEATPPDMSTAEGAPPPAKKLRPLDEGAASVLSVMDHEAIRPPRERYINGERVLEDQPVLLTGGVLRKYQVEGYLWLQLLYENGVNGILADEMGLGKTIQCVASIADLVYKGVPGPFLVCAPLSTLPNWMSEFHRFAPKVPCILYHGSREERALLRRQIYRRHEIRPGVKVQSVVITSFEITMNDRKHLNCHLWKYVIVDEGHRIKNSRCRLVSELKMYPTTHKMLLTGTPVQNNLAELWSLLHFLLPELFDQLSSFEEFLDVAAFDDAQAREAIVKEERQKQVLSMLHELLSPFILRRLKADVSVTIPPKREVLVYAPLSRTQMDQYRSILDRSIGNLIDKKKDDAPVVYDKHGRPVRGNRTQVNYEEMMDAQTDKGGDDEGDDLGSLFNGEGKEEATNVKKGQRSQKSCVNVQLRNMMMLLRKCCNHPYLIEYPLTPSGEYLVDEQLVTSSGKFMLLDRMLTSLKEQGHKVLLFSQMTSILDVIEDYCNLREFSYFRLDGSTTMDERRRQIEEFNGGGDTFVFLLSTRAGGLGINLAAADTVIIFDSDWNPQQDLQAQDRCHRIGQSRPVLVFRLVTENTIDMKIVERADAKRKLEKLVLHPGKFKSQNFQANFKPITPEEVMELLKAVTYDKVIDGYGQSSEVISDIDLERLLDRSDLQRLWQRRLAEQNGEKLPEPSEPACCSVEGKFKVLAEDLGRIGLGC